MKRKPKTQNGSLYPEGRFWYLRYYDNRVIDGQVQRKRLTKQLASVTDADDEKARELADDFLKTINKPRLRPETAVTLVDFVERVYFPQAEEDDFRPSTLRGYKEIWNDQLKPHCTKLWMRDIRTSTMQNVLHALAREKDPLTGEQRLNKTSLKHAKSFLSGVFRIAIQLDYFPSDRNPMQQTTIPRARPKEETYAYSLEEIDSMLAVLPEPAATIVAVAAYTGARRGEIRGMRWEKYTMLREVDPETGKQRVKRQMFIAQSVWGNHTTEPKSAKSKAPVPIIRQLADRLELHRARLRNPIGGPVFPNEKGKPADLNNVINRIILPVLSRCGDCKKGEAEHGADSDHEYKRDASLPEWHGWHAFRRGLATNLYRMRVKDKTIQEILRHENVSTTQDCYIKTVSDDVQDAMENLENSLLASKSASNRPFNEAVPISSRTM